MTDVETKKIVTISDLPPEILETLFPLLDFVCLKSCRLVCTSWEVFSRQEMMKRSAINPCKTGHYRIEDRERAGLYSSWKINYPSTFFRYFEPASNLEGRNVKYMKIHFTIPFGRRFCSWLQRLLTIDCPNIEELAFDFGFRNWRVENRRDFFIEYLTDDTCLPLIRTLRFFRIANTACREFAMTLIAACPNLEHLFFTEITRSRRFVYEIYEERHYSYFHEWDVLSRLAQMPEVTGKLKTIEWTVNKEGRDFDNVNVDGGTSQELKFSENLQRLHWDVMRIEGGQNGGIVPRGILISFAGSLRELSVRRGFRVGRTPIESLGLPVLQNLCKLQIGIEAYATVALSELVDAAPNLTRLEILDDKEYRRYRTTATDLWGTSPKEMKKHPNLKIFVTEVGFEELELSIFEKTLKKFPNLKKLYVGACQLELSGAFNALKDNARQLEHLYWVTQRKLYLSQLCDHLVLDVAKVSSWGNLKYYYFEYTGYEGHPCIEIWKYQQRREEIWQGMKEMRKETRVFVFRPFTMCNCGDHYEDDNDDKECETERKIQSDVKAQLAQRCDALNELERFIRENGQIPISFVKPEYDINRKRRLIF
jgi:hypothetical protein